MQLQGRVWGSCLVEKGRETTPDASAKNSRKQDCDKLGQTSCGWLCDLQSVPSKLDSKPSGTMFTSEDVLSERALKHLSSRPWCSQQFLSVPHSMAQKCSCSGIPEFPLWLDYCPHACSANWGQGRMQLELPSSMAPLTVFPPQCPWGPQAQHCWCRTAGNVGLARSILAPEP